MYAITNWIQVGYVCVVALVIVIDAVGMLNNKLRKCNIYMVLWSSNNTIISYLPNFLFLLSTGTLTFRWKEYGELTHYQADSTSILFLFCHSRWLLRLGSSKKSFKWSI